MVDMRELLTAELTVAMSAWMWDLRMAVEKVVKMVDQMVLMLVGMLAPVMVVMLEMPMVASKGLWLVVMMADLLGYKTVAWLVVMKEHHWVVE